MALIECEECNRNVSSKASACPHCGMPNSQHYVKVSTTASSRNFKTIGAVLSCLGVVVAAANKGGAFAGAIILIDFCLFIAARLKDG